MKRNNSVLDPGAHYAIQEKAPLADTSFVKRKFLDIPYAELSPSQKLDIYLPDSGSGPFPVIVAIHGGAFMGCDKADSQILPMLAGIPLGFAVVSINYRLSGEALFPALVHDAKAAVRWIRAHSPEYGFDPTRIVAWGGSAGGYLASMLAVTAENKDLEDLNMGNNTYPCTVQAAVIWYGPTNFLKMDEQLAQSGIFIPSEFYHSSANSPESLLLGDLITSIPDRVFVSNPETHITDVIPPILLQHGRKDAVVPFQQSVEFYKKLKGSAGGAQVILEIFEDAEHADTAFETPENIARVFHFLHENKIS
jgi:acetyl esterase/lipase